MIYFIGWLISWAALSVGIHKLQKNKEKKSMVFTVGGGFVGGIGLLAVVAVLHDKITATNAVTASGKNDPASTRSVASVRSNPVPQNPTTLVNSSKKASGWVWVLDGEITNLQCQKILKTNQFLFKTNECVPLDEIAAENFVAAMIGIAALSEMHPGEGRCPSDSKFSKCVAGKFFTGEEKTTIWLYMLDSSKLTVTLSSSKEKCESYVGTILRLMKENQLSSFAVMSATLDGKIKFSTNSNDQGQFQSFKKVCEQQDSAFDQSNNFTKACDRGDMMACNNMGVSEKEKGNKLEAMKLFKNACDGGEPLGCYNFGIMEDDKVESQKYVMKACNGKVMMGCYNLGVEDEKKGNKVEAKRYYSMACDGEVMMSCLNLGVLEYKQGNKVEGKRYLIKACDGGEMVGCFNLAIFAAREGNTQEAKQYLNKGCKGGDNDSCNALKKLTGGG